MNRKITLTTENSPTVNTITGTVIDKITDTMFQIQLENQECVNMDLKMLIKDDCMAINMNKKDWNEIKQKTTEQMLKIGENVEKKLNVPQLISQDKFWSGVEAKLKHQVNGYSSQRNYHPS